MNRDSRKWRLGIVATILKFWILLWLGVTLATPIGIYAAFVDENNALKGVAFLVALVVECLIGWFVVPKYFRSYVQFRPGGVSLYRMGEVILDSDDVTMEVPPRGFDGFLPGAARVINYRNKGALRPQSLAIAYGGQAMWHFRLNAFIADAERNQVPVIYMSFED